METKTITSDMVISFEDLAEVMEEGFDEVMEVPEFNKTVTYRRYDFDFDNMTGDRDRSSFNDYTTTAEVQPMEISDKEVRTGELQVGDAEIFLPARVRATNGTEFRPQTYDEIVWKGIRYIIQKITFERIGKQEIFADCFCKRIGNENPKETWNENYEKKHTSDVRPGKGWT